MNAQSLNTKSQKDSPSKKSQRIPSRRVSTSSRAESPRLATTILPLAVIPGMTLFIMFITFNGVKRGG